jgi:L-fuculose-phosphate aldolase
MADPQEVKEAVLHAAKAMHRQGLVSGTAGNVSGRLDDERVVMTPSSIAYEPMTLDDLVVVDLDGNVLEGHRSATTEKVLHLGSFREYPEVGGVLHCHPIHASMFALLHEPIPAHVEEFVVFVGGEVPVGDYKVTGTDELADEVTRLLADRSAMLMANHGMVCVGKTVEDALHTAELVEHNARIIAGARSMGTIVPLPEKTNADFGNVYRYVRGSTWRPAES